MEGLVATFIVVVLCFWVLPELTKITGMLSVRFYWILGTILITVIILSLVRRRNQ